MEQRLTATEARVAALVASGHSNREIGAALALQVEVVECNLGGVYRKFGVRSRMELALLLTPMASDGGIRGTVACGPEGG